MKTFLKFDWNTRFGYYCNVNIRDGNDSMQNNEMVLEKKESIFERVRLLQLECWFNLLFKRCACHIARGIGDVANEQQNQNKSVKKNKKNNRQTHCHVAYFRSLFKSILLSLKIFWRQREKMDRFDYVVWQDREVKFDISNV